MEWRIQDNEQDWRIVRNTVFVDEQGFKEEFDELDHKAIHITLYDDGKLIGCVRCLHVEEAFRIGRVAILAPYRKKGYGVAMLQYAEHLLKEKGAFCIYLDAQCKVVDFYIKCGYQVCGDLHYDEGVAHREMKKGLS